MTIEDALIQEVESVPINQLLTEKPPALAAKAERLVEPVDNDPFEKGLSLQEAAYVYGYSKKQLRKLIQDGELPAVQVKGKKKVKWRVFPAGLPSELQHVYNQNLQSVDFPLPPEEAADAYHERLDFTVPADSASEDSQCGVLDFTVPCGLQEQMETVTAVCSLAAEIDYDGHASWLTIDLSTNTESDDLSALEETSSEEAVAEVVTEAVNSAPVVEVLAESDSPVVQPSECAAPVAEAPPKVVELSEMNAEEARPENAIESASVAECVDNFQIDAAEVASPSDDHYVEDEQWTEKVIIVEPQLSVVKEVELSESDVPVDELFPGQESDSVDQDDPILSDSDALRGRIEQLEQFVVRLSEENYNLERRVGTLEEQLKQLSLRGVGRSKAMLVGIPLFVMLVLVASTYLH